jgi:hypothetical protein
MGLGNMRTKREKKPGNAKGRLTAVHFVLCWGGNKSGEAARVQREYISSSDAETRSLGWEVATLLSLLLFV